MLRFFMYSFMFFLVAHLRSLENTANTKTLAIPEAKNVRMAAPAQWWCGLLENQLSSVLVPLVTKPPFVKLPSPTILARTVPAKMEGLAPYSRSPTTLALVLWDGKARTVPKLIIVPAILVDKTACASPPGIHSAANASMALMDRTAELTLTNAIVVLAWTVPLAAILTDHTSKCWIHTFCVESAADSEIAAGWVTVSLVVVTMMLSVILELISM